ncbi:uncharacterized protein [Mycetomoellerius zeteki]|uniref:uncharacterized protein n=1 Tax=Mycetomoellerius zeteki TaxID=64791 RepID=UPI00084E5020|nr:PREDICTED: uncharacterized protein LOC108731165 [Trachymyrmex zeteki]
MLIGAEIFWRLICAGQIKSAKDQPTLQKTLFGWILFGPTVDHTISSLKFSPEHQACENLFRDTVKRNSDGRFVVQLPVKSDKLSKLGDYKEIAIRHMREVTHPTESNNISYYLPHHPVFKETSTSTKLRVVFDGSCKTTSGISLTHYWLAQHYKMIYSQY